ncbi:hypothetical protein FE392_13315 [Xenorhabdus sp. 12]|uniref:Uncharacterized protein n=1 Tax=Xenorhabdus santafensis TaxID=2582833 RepID=A0ABU4SBZ7_9GAMM|nr:hypothetical protein [Xenorhabdus sp. 12]MDX7988300.1 hypothetical protein [Xenorhabdus sp. 12]
MSIENIVKEALSDTRRYFNLKTQNKCYEESARLELPEHKRQFYLPEKIEERYALLSKSRSQMTYSQSPYKKNHILESTQGNDHVGNCDEYSSKAFKCLIKKSRLILEIYQREFDISIIHITSPSTQFNHGIVMISSNYLNQFTDRENLPDLFNRYHDSEIWICDPWANIACLSYNYPIEWKNKMFKWDGKGKLLNSPGGILEPTDFKIVTLIGNGIKSVAFNQNVKFSKRHIR